MPTGRARRLSAHATAPPTLGATLKQIREHRSWSRYTASRETHVSDNYIKDIEAGRSKPSTEILDQLVAGYRLDPMQARHLYNLRHTPEDLAPPDQLRERISSSEALRTGLVDLDHRGILAAYVDPTWTILWSNSRFQQAVPGLAADMSVPVWVFSHDGLLALHDWDAEAKIAVASLRAVAGRYRDSVQVRTSLASLARNPEFRERWASTIDVMFIRPSDVPLHLRNPDRTTTSYTLRISPTDSTGHISLLHAVESVTTSPAL
ncbi:helix-turn-helix domain-containing protein [Nocardia puris]|uniref:helix-turn-helix domain-containing protein n=1 Tax=Nocardia puris TaxID=208602 RepID=UPI001895DEB4|nr:helix-turn-helix domain-containing protein [Nocardia puris]MBF6215497.1 helix-turn-helix domain-containing protein [Nocardia puris]MBF6369900.1 helix-turn-helix domain-containing protein [Nocardia puris]